jgi:hypothetical protein
VSVRGVGASGGAVFWLEGVALMAAAAFAVLLFLAAVGPETRDVDLEAYTDQPPREALPAGHLSAW